MITYNLFEKAFKNVYSHRMNAYVETSTLAEIYANQMKKYCLKQGCVEDYNDLYYFASDKLGLKNNFRFVS